MTNCVMVTGIFALAAVLAQQAAEENKQQNPNAPTTKTCSAKCKGNDCKSNCTGSMSSAVAIGFNAAASVIGELTTVECDGAFCHSSCDGQNNLCMSKTPVLDPFIKIRMVINVNKKWERNATPMLVRSLNIANKPLALRFYIHVRYSLSC